MKLSIFKSRMVPSHFLEQHEKFCDFVGLYMDFLCTEENSPFYTLDNLSNYTTLSESVNTFYYSLLRDEYAVDFPKSLIDETETFLRNIIHLYKTKGTETAYSYFFRLIYNVDITFKYPKDTILKYSDGKWVQNSLLNFEGLTIDDLKLIRGAYIKGMNTQAIGHILNVIDTDPPIKTVFEFNLANIQGNEFLINEFTKDYDVFRISNEIFDDVFLLFDGVDTNQKIYEIQNESNFIVEVRNKNVVNIEHIHVMGNSTIWVQIAPDGQIIEVPDPSSELDPDKQYALTIDMVQGVFDFNETVTIVSGDVDLVGKMFTVKSISYTQGYWKNTDGLLNSDKLIQDNYYYQNYSYVIQTKIKPSQYFYSLKKLLHPAGLMLFTEYVQGAGDESDFVELPEPIFLQWHHLFLTILHFVDVVCKIGLNKKVHQIKREFQLKRLYEHYIKLNDHKKFKTPDVNLERKHTLELIRDFRKNVIMDMQEPLNLQNKNSVWYKKQTFLWDKFTPLDMLVTSENYDNYPVETVELHNFEQYSDLVFYENQGNYAVSVYNGFNSPKEIGTYFDYKINSTRSSQKYTVIDDPDILNQKILFTYDTLDGYSNLTGFIAFNEKGNYLKTEYFDLTIPGKISYSGPESTTITFYYINYSVLHENWMFEPFEMTEDNRKVWLEKSVLFFDQDGKFISNNDLYLDKNDNTYKSIKTYPNIDVIVLSENESVIFDVTEPTSYIPLKFEKRDIQPLHYLNILYTPSIDYGYITEEAEYEFDFGLITDNDTTEVDYGKVTEEAS